MSEEKKEKVAKVAASGKFRKTFMVLGILFVLLTGFIAVQPEIFTQFGYPGIFAFNIVGSGLLLLPVLSTKFNLLLLILFSALGNIINTSINYFVGYSGRDALPQIKVVTTLLEKGARLIQRFGLFVVYILAIAPFPLDVAGLLSGYVRIPYKKYVLVNFLGKVTIFLLVGLGVITLLKK